MGGGYCEGSGLFRGFVFLFCVFFFLFSASSVFLLLGYAWHDQQRIAQLFLLIFSCCFALLPKSCIGGPFIRPLLVIFLLGLVSVVLADIPLWAAREWALQVGLVILSLLLARMLADESKQWIVMYVAAVVGGVLSFQFFVGYAAAFLSGIRQFDAYTLFSGFSNPRFFGQFQVVLVPFLAGLALHLWGRRPGLSILVVWVLASHWSIAYALGGRGFILAMLVAHFSLLLIEFKFVRFVCLQVCSALAGLLLYWMLFFFVPFYLDIVPVLPDVLRSGLSAREVLWNEAWQLASDNPWLGVGPMHFSAYVNSVAAHPHQMLLQWASEWGVPVAAVVLGLTGWGVFCAARFLRHQPAFEMDAALWAALVGGLVLAQVDGVFVMPYTQTWMAMVVALALARWSSCQPLVGQQSYLMMSAAVMVVGILGHVLITDALDLPEIIQRFFERNTSAVLPRFWSQGWITGQ